MPVQVESIIPSTSITCASLDSGASIWAATWEAVNRRISASTPPMIRNSSPRMVLVDTCTLMSVGLMMLPALAARLWTHKLDAAIALAAVFGVASAYAGLVASYALSLPSGPSIVLAAGVVYFVSLVFGRAGGALRRLPKRRHLEA